MWKAQVGEQRESKLLSETATMRLFCLLFLILTACATRYSVPEDYARRVKRQEGVGSQRTVVFFLIDGLPVSTLKAELRNRHLPEIQKHFLGPKQSLMLAHSIFPTLTFPNIASLLHEQPVHQTEALGNTLISDRKVIQFEAVLDRPKFGEVMKGHTVFSRLSEKGLRSVSLDYGLGVDATVSSEIIDLKSGLAAEFMDYLYLDQKRIDSLKILLTNHPVSQWPEFIFVHLVGLDFLSHQFGPRSEKTVDYLASLDRSLKEVFELLRQGEKDGHEVVSMLSADHGFMPATRKRVKIEDVVEAMDPKFSLFNEGRMAALYYPETLAPGMQASWAAKLIQTPGLEIVSYREGNRVRILSKKLDVSFDFQKTSLCPESSMAVAVNGSLAVCPGQLELVYKKLFYPFFIENLAYYFQASKHPDLIVIPEPGVAFHESEMGFHGGPTADETIVPLLMRNATLPDPSQIPANWELLRFL
jgi:hypothetical protein